MYQNKEHVQQVGEAEMKIGRHQATHLEIRSCKGTPSDRDRDGQNPVGIGSQMHRHGERLGDTGLETERLGSPVQSGSI